MKYRFVQLNTARDNYPNLEQIDRKTASKTAAIAPANNIDLDIQESVSKLESDISKTIENNNNKLKEVQAEIEKLKYKKTKFDELPTEVETIDLDDDDNDDEDDEEDEDIDDIIPAFEEITQSVPILTESDSESKIITTPMEKSTTTMLPPIPITITTMASLVETIASEIDLKEITSTIIPSIIDPMVVVTKISTTPKVSRPYLNF